MTDYSSPTVIQPNIPSHCMTPLEWLLLTNMFGWEVVNGEYYFFAEDTPNNVIEFQTKELRAAIAASKDCPSSVLPRIEEQLSGGGPDPETFCLDISLIPWECVFQDVLRHNPQIPYITAVTSFVCSKMRPDGFGGLAVVITAKSIRGKTTQDVIDDLLEEEPGPSTPDSSNEKEASNV